MEIRPYKTEDIQEIAELFYQTVHTVNAADYTDEQLDAWADGNIDLAAWDRSFQEHMTLVAVITQSEAEDKKDASEQIAGFADMNSTGYMDRLYVHKDFQHCGIASALCDRLEEAVDAAYERLSTRLRELYPPLRDVELQVCLLVKIDLQPSQVAALILRSRQAVASLRSRLYAKVFGQKGSPDDWDAFLKEL